MPREYRQSTGRPGPNPSGFGSADLNLQTPRYVAQTNVAVPENPFETLQKVLGLGVDIFSTMKRMETADIEGKINYERAVEAKAERDRIKDAREADAWKSKQRLRIAQAKTPEEAKQLESEYMAGASDTETPEQQRIRAELIETAESESRQIAAELRLKKSEEEQAILDENIAINAKFEDAVNTAYEAGDVKALESIRLDAAKRAQNSAPRTATVYQRIRENVTSKLEKINNEIELKNRMATNAAAAAAATMTETAAMPIADAMLMDREALVRGLSEYSGEALRAAVMDYVRDRIAKSRPEVADAWWNGSDEEIAATNAALLKIVDPVVDTIVSMRNADTQQRNREMKIADLGQRASVSASFSDIQPIYDEISSDVDMTDPQKQAAYREAVTQYISGGTTAIDRLRRADEQRYSDNGVVSSRATLIMNRLIADEMQKFSVERQALIKSGLSETDAEAAGWDLQYKNKDEFITWVLGRFGTDPGALNDPMFPAPLSAAVAELGRQYDTDLAKTEAKQRQIEADVRRNDADKRRAMKVEDHWDESPIASAIRDGSFRTLGAYDTERMLMDSLIGYSNSSVPKDLENIIVGDAGNPDNFTLIKSFWKIYNMSADPAARNSLLRDGKYRISFAVGNALQYLDYDREVTAETTIKMVQEFSSNLMAYENPKEDSPEGRAQRDMVNDTVANLAIGSGIDTGFFDLTGVSSEEAYNKLSPVDKTTMMVFATSAANWPNAGDRTKLMGHMMRSQGYQTFAYQTDNGQSFKIIQNVRGRSGTRPLPNPDIVDSSQFQRYLDSKKEEAAKVLSSIRQLDIEGRPKTFTAAEITGIRIAPYDMDIRDGYVAVQVKTGSRWINLDTNKIRVTEEDYAEYVSSPNGRERPAPTFIPPRERRW